MYVCVCVCMYICVCVCVYVCMYVCLKLICIVNPFDLLLKKSQKSNLSLDNKNLKWGGNIIMKYILFSNRRWTQLLAPLEILMSKISLKYISIHIHNFEYSRVIMNMKLSRHGFLLHRNINRRENKAQIPLIIITMRKT